jgi:hypothetical protein
MRRMAPWLGLAGLAALVVASASMEKRALPPLAIAALAAGLLVWVAVAWIDPPAQDGLGALDPPARGPRLVPLVLALAAAGVCGWKMPPEEFRLPGVAAWAAAILFWFWAWWAPRGPVGARSALPTGQRFAAWGAMALIMAAAAWFQFHDLAGVPSNPISDHAEEMLDMRDLLEGRHGVYFWRNLGNGPLHFYWAAFLVRGIGLPLNYLTLKTATAIFGLLVAPALFLLGRELGGVWLGVAAAGFGAWSQWSVALARQGVEFIYPIPLTALVLWALLRYQRRGDRGSALAAGAAIGIGLHTYLSFRIVPLLVALSLGAALFDRRRQGRRWRTVGDGLLVAATSAILFLPVLKFAFFGENRAFFWSRIATRATAAERPLAVDPWHVFAGNLWNMAKAFHWKGSSTWTVLSAGEPFLDVVAGGLLFAGLILAVRLALGGSWRWTTLLPALFLLTLPTTLAIAYPDENPSLNRAGPALPVVFLLVGLAFAHLWNGFLRERIALRVAGLSALLAGAGYSLQENAEAYFDRLAVSYDALIEHSMEIAAVIGQYRNQGIPIGQQYLLAVDFWVDARNIALELGDPAWSDTNNIAPPKVPEELTARPLLFVYRANDRERLRTLERLYPGGAARIIPQSHPDRNFGVYLVR